MSHYMAELVLTGREVLMVGGGRVAWRKLNGLVDCEVRVRVVAPELDERMVGWVEGGRVEHIRKEFDEGMLDSRPFLVFAVTSDGRLNELIAGMCRERGILCNSADNPVVSGFLVPAVVKRGPVTVGVGTSGMSPALSRLLKERLDRWLEVGWGELVAVFGGMRAKVKGVLPDVEKRRLFWRRVSLAVEEERRFEKGRNEEWFEERLKRAKEE